MLKRYLNDLKGNISLLNNKFLLVDYEKIEKPGGHASGYSKRDLKAVAGRYLASSVNVTEEKLLTISAFKDLRLFLNKDCSEAFKIYKNWKILDVGCGSGLYSKLFNGKSFPYGQVVYSGCETDQILVNACKKINPNVNFFKSYADKIRSTDKMYDLVFSSSVLHYTLSKWQASLKEFSRVSKKYVLISRVPFSKYYPSFYVKQTVQSLQGREFHYFIVINREEFENYVRKLGFRIVVRDYSSEEYNIKGVDEKIMLAEYLLEK